MILKCIKKLIFLFICPNLTKCNENDAKFAKLVILGLGSSKRGAIAGKYQIEESSTFWQKEADKIKLDNVTLSVFTTVGRDQVMNKKSPMVF